MKTSDIEKALKEIGLPFKYHHFKTSEAVVPPFICYIFPRSNNFDADGKVYEKISAIDIELYTDEKDIEIESKIEAVLDKYGFVYEKNEIWIQSEELFEVVYEMEGINNE